MASRGDPAISLSTRWAGDLERATRSDKWGQVVEATDQYEKCLRDIRSSMDRLELSGSERNTINKTLLCITLRLKDLGSASDPVGPLVENMEELPAVLRVLFTDPAPFPVDLSLYGGDKLVLEPESKKEEPTRGGTLAGAPAILSGQKYISVEIIKWGLKDAETYVDPRVTVCVYDGDGATVEPSQDTPYARAKEAKHVIFGDTVHLQSSVSALESRDAAIFFEFKHFKPKGKYVSTRCWALMEMDEVKTGRVNLEIYKKPTDPKRKKIRLHSVKDLWLELRVTINSV